MVCLELCRKAVEIPRAFHKSCERIIWQSVQFNWYYVEFTKSFLWNWVSVFRRAPTRNRMQIPWAPFFWSVIKFPSFIPGALQHQWLMNYMYVFRDQSGAQGAGWITVHFANPVLSRLSSLHFLFCLFSVGSLLQAERFLIVPGSLTSYWNSGCLMTLHCALVLGRQPDWHWECVGSEKWGGMQLPEQLNQLLSTLFLKEVYFSTKLNFILWNSCFSWNNNNYIFKKNHRKKQTSIFWNI